MVVGLDVSFYEAHEGTSDIVFCIVIISGEIDRNVTLRVSTVDSTAVAGGILHFLCSSITTMQKNSSDVVMFSNIAQAIDLTHKI